MTDDILNQMRIIQSIPDLQQGNSQQSIDVNRGHVLVPDKVLYINYV